MRGLSLSSEALDLIMSAVKMTRELCDPDVILIYAICIIYLVTESVKGKK